MTDLSGSQPPDRPAPTLRGPERAHASTPTRQRTAGEQQPPPDHQTARGDGETAGRSRHDPAVAVAPSLAHLEPGQRIEGTVERLDGERRPILRTAEGTYALRPDAGLKPGDEVAIRIARADRRLEGDLVGRDGRPVDPPVRFSLTLLAVHGPTAETIEPAIEPPDRAPTGPVEAVPPAAPYQSAVPVAAPPSDALPLPPAPTPLRTTAIAGPPPTTPAAATVPTAAPPSPGLAPPTTPAAVLAAQEAVPPALPDATAAPPLAPSPLPVGTILAGRLIAPPGSAITADAAPPQTTLPPGTPVTLTIAAVPGAPAPGTAAPAVTVRVLAPLPAVQPPAVDGVPHPPSAQTPHPVRLATPVGVVEAHTNVVLKPDQTLAATVIVNTASPSQAPALPTAPETPAPLPSATDATRERPDPSPQPAPSGPAAPPSTATAAPASPTTPSPTATPTGTSTPDTAPAGLPPPSSALPLPPLPPLLPLVDYADDWPVMRAVADAATAAVNPDGSVATALGGRLATPGPKLTNTLLFFAAALGRGDPRAWLGEDTARALEQAGRASLLSRLEDEFARLARVADRPAGEWRAMVLPLFVDGGAQALTLLVRQWGEGGHPQTGGDDTETDDGPDGTRFVVDVTLSRLGALQLDGLLRGQRFDLAVRSARPLGSAIERDIAELFARALEADGLTGGVRFEVGTPFPVDVTGLLTKSDDTDHHPSVIV